MKSKYNPKERANKKDIQLNIDSENKLSKAMREVCETENQEIISELLKEVLFSEKDSEHHMCDHNDQWL